MNRSLNVPVAGICALALLLAAVTGAVSGTVSARLTAVTAPDTPPDAFSVQSPTRFTEMYVSGPIGGSGGLNVAGNEILLGDTGQAANATIIKIDDTAQTVEIGNANSPSLIVEPGAGLLNSSSLDLLSRTHVITATASDELNSTYTGSLVANIGATGAITMTLTPAQKGDNFCFYVGAAQALNVDPATGDQIVALTNTAGDKISNSTPGGSVCLVAANTSQWLPIGTVGTWSDAN